MPIGRTKANADDHARYGVLFVGSSSGFLAACASVEAVTPNPALERTASSVLHLLAVPCLLPLSAVAQHERGMSPLGRKRTSLDVKLEIE